MTDGQFKKSEKNDHLMDITELQILIFTVLIELSSIYI